MTADEWPSGSFVSVRADSPEKAGMDGMVTVDFGDGSVGLFFGYDRYNQAQDVVCGGSELWLKDELDITTLDLNNRTGAVP